MKLDLLKETGDGKWDLSELSEVIGKQVGTDAKLNRDAKKILIHLKFVGQQLN